MLNSEKKTTLKKSKFVISEDGYFLRKKLRVAANAGEPPTPRYLHLTHNFWSGRLVFENFFLKKIKNRLKKFKIWTIPRAIILSEEINLDITVYLGEFKNPILKFGRLVLRKRKKKFC